jgi:hypothetical protein
LLANSPTTKSRRTRHCRRAPKSTRLAETRGRARRSGSEYSHLKPLLNGNCYRLCAGRRQLSARPRPPSRLQRKSANGRKARNGGRGTLAGHEGKSGEPSDGQAPAIGREISQKRINECLLSEDCLECRRISIAPSITRFRAPQKAHVQEEPSIGEPGGGQNWNSVRPACVGEKDSPRGSSATLRGSEVEGKRATVDTRLTVRYLKRANGNHAAPLATCTTEAH